MFPPKKIGAVAAGGRIAAGGPPMPPKAGKKPAPFKKGGKKKPLSPKAMARPAKPMVGYFGV